MHKSGPISTSLGKAGYSDFVVCGTGQGYAKSKDGLELHMATNYLGPFLLTMLLLPSLQRSASKVGNPPALFITRQCNLPVNSCVTIAVKHHMQR